MSRVFVAVEHALGRRVVVKVLAPELAAGISAERFKREIQLAAQLEYAHERGIVHRDIKPDNVLISRSSAAVLASPRGGRPQ